MAYNKNLPIEKWLSTVMMDRNVWSLSKSERTKCIQLGNMGLVPYRNDMAHKWNPTFNYLEFLENYKQKKKK